MTRLAIGAVGCLSLVGGLRISWGPCNPDACRSASGGRVGVVSAGTWHRRPGAGVLGAIRAGATTGGELAHGSREAMNTERIRE
jgi:hypothetical protein